LIIDKGMVIEYRKASSSDDGRGRHHTSDDEE
jgi:hypothetical protein